MVIECNNLSSLDGGKPILGQCPTNCGTNDSYVDGVLLIHIVFVGQWTLLKAILKGLVGCTLLVIQSVVHKPNSKQKGGAGLDDKMNHFVVTETNDPKDIDHIEKSQSTQCHQCA